MGKEYGKLIDGYRDEYEKLGEKFKNPPRISLELATQTIDGKVVGSVDVAATTAIQCYAPGVAVMKPRPEEKFQAIARSTLDAGHHTTRMHTHYTWLFKGVSRSATHDVFNQYIYYNTEQQSQRYVEAKEGNYLMPTNLPEREERLFREAAGKMNQAYFVLLERLRGEIGLRMREMYPEAGWNVPKTSERLSAKADKLCQEVARYVLPIGQLTTYYYTLNELQLLRLFRASQMSHFSDETRYVIGQMVNSVLTFDPTFSAELSVPLERDLIEGITTRFIGNQKAEFDEMLGGRQSVLISDSENARNILIRAGRNVLGMPRGTMADEEILFRIMDPGVNRKLADVYETGSLDPLTTGLRQVGLTFASKLSHAGDSQRQRHRRTPGDTPAINELYDGTTDYLMPMVVRENDELAELYAEVMNETYENINRLLAAGVAPQTALLLVPNAQAIRTIESGDLFDWLHRYKQRLCYLAQEEIFFVSVEQIEQLAEVLPEAGEMLLAPCGVRQRAAVSPRCPEGERWCGKPVFKYKINQYKKNRLV